MKVPTLRPIEMEDVEFLELIKEMLGLEILNVKQMLKLLEVYNLD